jgi:hypothetical protein
MFASKQLSLHIQKRLHADVAGLVQVFGAQLTRSSLWSQTACTCSSDDILFTSILDQVLLKCLEVACRGSSQCEHVMHVQADSNTRSAAELQLTLKTRYEV